MMYMQVVECCRELDADVKHFLYRKRAIFSLLEIGRECFTWQKVHHEIPALVLYEIIVDARQVGMNEVSQQKHLTPARFNQREGFWRVLVILAYFLEGYDAL